MVNRIDRINDFLQWLSSVCESNPDLDISENLVYANLTRVGIKQAGKLDIFFSDWINNFKNTNNIDVFVSENAKYFCQFVNTENNPSFMKGDFIKIYIPVDEEHIYSSANMLFEYMAKNNILHSSKIGSDVRFDDIVIRVKDEKSANLIKDYVKNNAYIQEGLMLANPFAINDEKIAVACDDRISYNSEVAGYISDYINDLKSKNALKSANHVDFINYIIDKYNNTFIYGLELEKFLKKHNITGPREDVNKKIVNHMEVSQLIITALSKDSNINDFKDHWNKIHNDIYKQSLISHVDKRLDDCYKKLNNEDTEEIIPISRLENILSTAINNTYEKYGLAQTVFALEQFINKNDASAFTNTNNSRAILKNSMDGNEAKTLIVNLLNGQYNIEKYISYAIQKNTLLQKQRTLDEASIETCNKYGIEQLYFALSEASKNNFKSFTNEKNSRKNLINTINFKEIDSIVKDILKSEGYDISNTNTNFYYLYTTRIQNILTEQFSKNTR